MQFLEKRNENDVVAVALAAAAAAAAFLAAIAFRPAKSVQFNRSEDFQQPSG